MTPGQRHAALAVGALVPALAYETVEIRQGDDGWPYSRFLRLLPAPLFLLLLAGGNGWLAPHIVIRKTAKAVATVVEAFDDSRPEIGEIL